MGGRSSEREVSLRSGKKVLASLKSQEFDAIGLDTDNLVENLKKKKIDIVFLALHGKYGEDGTIQGLLEMYGYPYTGSGVLASALAMDKVASKRIFVAVDIPTPKFKKINNIKCCEGVKSTFPFPVVIKPVCEGSSIGVSIVKDKNNFDKAITKALSEFDNIFIEEYIKGCEVTVGIIGSGADTVPLPVLELVSKKEFYDFEAKYNNGMTEFIIPARLPVPLYEKVQETALAAHNALGCYGVSRVDIIVSKDGVAFVHDVNTIPGLTDLSDLPAQALTAGLTYDQLILRILESAEKK